MITIRNYRETDSVQVGNLIADTYAKFNLDFASPEELPKLLGPFRHARSTEQFHKDAIVEILKARMILVAEENGEIVGVLRGRNERLHSLFVREDHHRRGIGRMLMEKFEQECIAQGASKITLLATLYAVPFYMAIGYRRSTGVRSGWSFEARGLKYQPMKKVLPFRAPQIK
ncbi:MAG: GNAT family N-acetyltransferase [Bacteroidota bacterium]